MTIPVANLYYLYSYAWDRFEATQGLDVFAERAPDCIADLWAHVLTKAFERQVRRGLDHGYRSDEGRLSLPRGRIDPVRSTSTGALASAMLECQWDEFVSDTPANRIIKATMRRLAACAGLNKDLSHKLGRLVRGLNQATDVTLSLRLINSIQLNRHNAAYGMMIDISKLVCQFLEPGDAPGEFSFKDPCRDDAHMARVFQDFLTAWFERHRDPIEFRSVGPTMLRWPATALGSERDLKSIPVMNTDITMSGPNRTLIIDAKYYHDVLIARREDATRKIISGHLYQLHAYLTTWRHYHQDGPPPEGMLLYPTVHESVDINVLIHGFRVRVVTINLQQHWPQIHCDLARLLLRNLTTSMLSS